MNQDVVMEFAKSHGLINRVHHWAAGGGAMLYVIASEHTVNDFLFRERFKAIKGKTCAEITDQHGFEYMSGDFSMRQFQNEYQEDRDILPMSLMADYLQGKNVDKFKDAVHKGLEKQKAKDEKAKENEKNDIVMQSASMLGSFGLGMLIMWLILD